MRGVDVEELSASTSATAFEEQWQTFLIDGFPGWLPQAYVAASQYTKTKPRQLLNWMVADFLKPEVIREDATDEELEAGFRSLAIRWGAKVDK